MTSPTGSDLRSQGQNQVWRTDFLAPDPGSLLPCCFHWEPGGPGKGLPQGSLNCPWKFIIYRLNVDPKHTNSWGDLTGCPVEAFLPFLSVLCWQIKIQWTPFVGSLIKYSHCNCKQFLHLPLGLEDQTQTPSWEGRVIPGRRRYRKQQGFVSGHDVYLVFIVWWSQLVSSVKQLIFLHRSDESA